MNSLFGSRSFATLVGSASIVGIAFCLYPAMPSRVPGAQDQPIKIEMTEVTASWCARRLILDYSPIVGDRWLADEKTLEAKPEGVEEVAGYLREITKQCPELCEVVEYYALAKWEVAGASVVFMVEDGREETPLEIADLLERFDMLVLTTEQGHLRGYDGLDCKRLRYTPRNDQLCLGSFSALLQISPRYINAAVTYVAKLSFDASYPYSRFSDASISLQGESGNIRIRFSLLTGAARREMQFQCGPAGVEFMN